MKFFTLFSLVVFSVGSLSADVLYWLVDEDAGGLPSFSYAQVVAQSDNDKMELKVFNMTEGVPGRGTLVDASTFGHATPESYAYLDPTFEAWNSYRFYVELLNENFDVVATSSEGVGFSDLKGHIKSTQLDQPTAWAVSSFTANVPEPTSGLLMLFGLAGLGLRRKVEKLKS